VGTALDDDELAAWLRLLETPGIGRDAARRLLAAFGSPEGVFSAAAAARRQLVDAAAARALEQEPPEFPARLAAARAWRAAGTDRHVVTLGDPDYPSRLLQIADPPLLLYVQGDPALLSAPSVAIVGSRNATPQGADTARAFAMELSRAGFAIVSGLALGIDAAAHEGALDGRAQGGAGTLAVVGTGLDRVYPSRHRELAHRIAATGALASEFAPGMPPLAENFPQRNRLIAGLALGTVVVEAALQSGSLITARLAAEAGREVFAVPGSIRSQLSRGCHALIRQGAMLVESAAEIAAALGGLAGRERATAAPAVPESSSGRRDPLLEALGEDPCSLDALGARTGWGAAEMSARLLELELAGEVTRLPGGLYQRRRSA
jgi:DNA processing protein